MSWLLLSLVSGVLYMCDVMSTGMSCYKPSIVCVFMSRREPWCRIIRDLYWSVVSMLAYISMCTIIASHEMSTLKEIWQILLSRL